MSISLSAATVLQAAIGNLGLAAITNVPRVASLPRNHRLVAHALGGLVRSAQLSVASASTTLSSRQQGRARLLVASAAAECLAAPRQSYSAVDTDNTPPPPSWSIGVNYELHRVMQTSACGCSDGAPLRGLLKGCAEQNAIGSFAASGRSYHTMRHVFLCSAPPEEAMVPAVRGVGHDAGRLGERSGRNTTALVRVVRTPCLECWRHLCSIAEMVRRCSDATEQLTLHILIFNDEAEIDGSIAGTRGGDHRNSSSGGGTTDDDNNVQCVAVPPPAASLAYAWDPSLITASLARGDIIPHVTFAAF